MNDTRGVKRAPCAALRPWIADLWASGTSDGPATADTFEVKAEVKVPLLNIPSGLAHVAIRPSGDAIRLVDAGGGIAELGAAVVAGPRDQPYFKLPGAARDSVGFRLRSGALAALTGVPADALTNGHFALRELAPDEDLTEQLSAETDSERRLVLLESFLMSRLSAASALPDRLARAIEALERGAKIESVVSGSGLSHRHLNARLKPLLGMTPARYRRVRRLDRVMRLSRLHPTARWADLALAAGFADQAHMNRDFDRLAGITPGAYRKADAAAHLRRL